MTDSFAPLLRSLFNDLQDQRILLQLATIVVSVGLAAWFSWLMRPRLRGARGTRLELGLGSLRRLVFPLSALMLVFMGRLLVLQFQTNVALLNLAVPLLTALSAVGAPALEEVRVRRTNQWISRADGARVEPLEDLDPPDAADAPPAQPLERVS